MELLKPKNEHLYKDFSLEELEERLELEPTTPAEPSGTTVAEFSPTRWFVVHYEF